MALELPCDQCSGHGRDQDDLPCRHCDGSGLCDCPGCLGAYRAMLVEAAMEGRGEGG
jgi:hypothetical protein